MTASTIRPTSTGPRFIVGSPSRSGSGRRGARRRAAAATRCTATRGTAARRFRRRVDPDGQRDRVSAADVAGDGAELDGAAVVPEDVVALQADARQVAHRARVAVLRVDLLADVLRQGDLRGGDGARRIADG